MIGTVDVVVVEVEVVVVGDPVVGGAVVGGAVVGGAVVGGAVVEGAVDRGAVVLRDVEDGVVAVAAALSMGVASMFGGVDDVDVHAPATIVKPTAAPLRRVRR